MVTPFDMLENAGKDDGTCEAVSGSHSVPISPLSKKADELKSKLSTPSPSWCKKESKSKS